ncbi:RNA polymerase sigma factor [candidate division KSB1 bacterium]
MTEHIDAEKQLVNGILAGNKDAYELFIERYTGLVGHIVFRMVDNPADREDLCQDIFIKSIVNLKDFRFRSQLSTWIGRIAYNCCINYMKKLKLPLLDDMNSEYGAVEHSAGNPAPDQIAEFNETARQVERSIMRLPGLYRTIVTLYHVDEMSYKQIAEIMQMPVGTVKSCLFRARKRLKSLLTGNKQFQEI